MGRLTKAQLAERAEAITELRKLLKPGDTVYTTLKHVSRSGMCRHIGLLVIKKGEPRHISYWAAKALGYRQDRHDDGLIVGGAGMDMGFAVVYSLGRTLFPKGFKLRKGQRGRNGDTSGFDNDGGYALNQRWL